MRLEVLVCLAVMAVVARAAISVTPATLTDSNGNTADSNSQITWSALPPGRPYEVDPSAYEYAGLKALFDAIHTFVKIGFSDDPLPSEILGLIQGTVAFDFDLIMSLLKWGYGYAACVTIGLLFVLIFPIVGFCFCCCRCCCKNCGGKMEQKRTDKTTQWRACVCISLAISVTFLGCGMAVVYTVNQRMTTLITDMGVAVEANVKDLKRYADNTVDEVNYVAFDGYNFTARVMTRDLDNIGPLVGGAVQDDFNAKVGVDAAFDALLALDPLLKNILDDLASVETAKTNVAASITTLSSALSDAKNDIDATFVSCGAPCNPPIDTSGMVVNFDPDSMPSFATEQAELQDVYDQNLTSLVLTGKKEFDNISAIVETEAAPTVTSLKTMINSFGDTIDGVLGTVTNITSMFDSITGITGSVSNLTSLTVIGDLTVGDLENYRWIGGLVLTSFVLLIVILQGIGLICGCITCCCIDNNKLPTERGWQGNGAGNCLMASAGFIIIFGALIMLVLVWPLYAVGAPVEKVLCANLRDSETTLWADLIDGGDPDSPDSPYSTILGQQDGYTLGQLAFQDPAVPLTVTSLLSDCRENKAAWTTLYLDNFIDLDTMTNYSATIDVDGEIDKISVDLSTLELLDNNTKTQIQDMSTNLQQIDFAGLIAELSAQTINVSLSALSSSLTAVADSVSGTSTETALRNHASTIDGIEANELAAVASAQASMLATVVALNETATEVPTSTSNLITLLETTETDLQTSGEAIIKNQSKIFALRVMGIADQFVDFALETIKTEVGRCEPVTNFYDDIFVNTVCTSALDSLNSIWFAVGWCSAFMVLGLIFSVKFAKHVRKMDSLHPDDRGTGNNYGKSNKVHPV